MKRLTEEKKKEICEKFINLITESFGTRDKFTDSVGNTVKEYINLIDQYEGVESNYQEQQARTFKLRDALLTIVTNAYNEGERFWAETWGNFLTRLIYEEKLQIC
ncbi:10692_t:CDS:1 [Cetraspora pellucida]|uniref:10692_t:CDS:1 n=1 Tax=Cetraspora pellucida TaxID=1433469 RepID=A0ACA9M2Q3_9GLOM|nr:10692_t:CDS:1 [Cetraspora pellucida]